MKKIVLGKGLEERISQCDFCGETQKECIKSSVPITNYFHGLKDIKELKWLKKSTFSSPKLYWVLTDHSLYETREVSNDADICKDCIRQLVKLI